MSTIVIEGNTITGAFEGIDTALSSSRTSINELCNSLLSLDTQLEALSFQAKCDTSISASQKAIVCEENKRNAIECSSGKINAFISNASKIDTLVSILIDRRIESFYKVYSYLEPDIRSSLSKTAQPIVNVFSTLKDSIASICGKCSDDFNSILNIMSMSESELELHCNKYLELLSNGKLNDDEKRQLEQLKHYLGGVDINENMSDRDKKIVALFNKLYEVQHVDEANAMNNLFANCPAEYQSDINNIKYIAYLSEGDCHTVFFKYASQMKIAEYGTMRDGIAGNYFSSTDMSMHLNIVKMRSGNYGTFFHEAGHNIDMLMGIEITGEEKFFTYSVVADGDFHQVVYSDVENIVSSFVDVYSSNEKNLSDAEKAQIIDVLMGRKHDSSINDSDVDFAYRKVLEDITGAWKGKYSRKYDDGKEVGILEISNSGMLSEIMNGMTNNSLMVSREYTHNVGDVWSVANNTAGHPINWQDPIENWEDSPHSGYVSPTYYYETDGSHTGMAETEYFAEYLRVNMTKSNEEMMYTKTFLPDSWMTLDSEMMKIAHPNIEGEINKVTFGTFA